MSHQVPWFPHSLHKYVDRAAELREGWWYVVLEEVVDGTALLLRWPWPLADEKGRLLWPPGDDRLVEEAGIAVPVLANQLYRPNRLRRAPRVGDTFAVRQSDRAKWGASDPVDDVQVLFPDHAIDVSADARVAAKLAYQGSLVTAVAKRDVDSELVTRAATDRRKLQARELVTGQETGGPGPAGNGAAG